MASIEEKVLSKYRRNIARVIKNKYRRKSKIEARKNKFQLSDKGNMRKSINDFAKDIYKTYFPIIQEEIEERVNTFKESDEYKNAIIAEMNVDKKKISCRSLKKFQEFEINIGNDILDKITEEVNKNDTNISREEVKYILLSILYKIMDYLKLGYKIKIGTMMSIWLDKRDVRVNLPDTKQRILEDRLIPKIKLGSSFDYNLFQSINKDNKAIMNYYKAKMERFLNLMRKNGKGN